MENEIQHIQAQNLEEVKTEFRKYITRHYYNKSRRTKLIESKSLLYQ